MSDIIFSKQYAPQDGPKLEIVSALIETKTDKSVILEEPVSGIPCIGNFNTIEYVFIAQQIPTLFNHVT